MVRLVKGAFAEPAAIAATGKADVNERYRQGLDMLFAPQARLAGVYPVVASHDKAMIEHALGLAKAYGWHPHEYEFEFLYGVRPEWQRKLAAQGHQVRAYLPFGKSWFPYAIRRVGESPANAVLVLRAMLGG